MNADIKDLNPGVAKLVAYLRDHGFATTDSGDGQTKLYECDSGKPCIHILSTPAHLVKQSNRLVAEIRSLGIKLDGMNEDNSGPTIEAHLNPVNHFASITLWNVTDKDCTFPIPVHLRLRDIP